MKATLHTQISCECGCLMLTTHRSTILCMNEKCEWFDKEFSVPVVPVELIESTHKVGSISRIR
ncbi:hypothetical protein LCGC14_2198030 [marine sediment metagenome]|uniref:Uncharacterized protein n=1 Tax=marine sediment metagenome TaxID=412755 RepID=A0A0F9FUZ7_9ZZZZ